MLSFWILAALLTVIAVIALLRPLSRQASSVETEPRTAADVAVYRDQIAEIEADRARGLIGAEEAEAARIEIARRLIATSGESFDAHSKPTTSAAPSGPEAPPSGNATTTSGLTAERLFMAVAAAVPAIALALYLSLGSPGLPGRPAAERLAQAPKANADIQDLVARVEARLRAEPGDGQGWDVIGPVYLRLERYLDAAEAFRRSIAILGESPRRLTGLAESTVLASDGVVNEVARKAYQRLIELEPDRIDARFGLALALEQDGDLAAAEAAYARIAEDTPPMAPWRLAIKQRLDAIAERRGAGAAGTAGAVPAPDKSAAEAVAGLPEAQRRETILRMVESLAARLAADGQDAEGWQRLMRSWSVLGDTAKAEAALVSARKALAGNDKALAEINALAKSLGLKS